MEKEKESARMVDEIENEQYIILKDVKSFELTAEQEWDQIWITWMILVVFGLCFVNYIFGFLKNIGVGKWQY